MRWIDLLRMSSNSLKRRKLRTFLTVLGVVIGTASIVVMISLGLGLQESMYQEIEQSGGVTSLTVTGKGSSQMGGFYMGDTSNEEEATKYTTDDVIEQIKKLDHVADVQPVLSIDALLKKNGYIGYCPLTGMTEEGLKDVFDPGSGGILFESVAIYGSNSTGERWRRQDTAEYKAAEKVCRACKRNGRRGCGYI